MKKFLKGLYAQDIIRLFSFRPYLYFLLSVLFSQLAFNMMNVVLIFLIFFLTSSNFLVSIIVLTSLLPQVFLSFVGGVFADSNNKKNILVWGNLIRAIVVIGLFFTNSVIFLIYLITLLVSVVTQFYIPAETPIIPNLVPKKYLFIANSFFGLILLGSIFLGFVLAGPAVTFFGRSYVFLIVAALFALAAFFAYLIPIQNVPKSVALGNNKKLSSKVEESIISHLIESYKMLKTTSQVGSAFALLILSQVVVYVLAIIVPGYAEGVLKISAENVSLLLFAPAAIGMTLAAIVVSTVLKSANRNILMTAGVFISGFVLLAFPFAEDAVYLIPKFLHISVFHIVVLISFLGGVGNASIFIPAQTTIQEKIPENYRSKIYGLLFACIGFFALLPMLIVGGLADAIGVNFVLIILSIIVFIGGFLQMFLHEAFKK